MSEKWEKYYSKDQLKRIQQLEIENLKAFIDVCEKLDLEFFLYGGTLLGQVKYKGFIPWDDDIDLALPRKSYEIFVREAESLLPEGFFIQSPYNCTNSPYPYTKLRKRGTRYIEYANRNLDIETGVYIDIYPVDKIPDDERKRKRQFNSVHKWIFIFVCRQSRLYDKDSSGIKGKMKNLARFIVCKALVIFPQKYCIKKIDKHMTKYNNSTNKRYGALNSPNYNNIYDSIYPLIKAKFEDIDVFLPSDYKNHLLRRYGNYNELPPERERIGHIPYIIEI